MTDLADNLGPTLACQSCAAEVAIEVAVRNGFDCPECGASLPERPDYAIEGAATAVEVARAYGAYGYDEEFARADTADAADAAAGSTICPGCSAALAGDELVVDARRTIDADTGPSGTTEVLAVRCPRCKTAGVVVVDSAGEEARAGG